MPGRAFEIRYPDNYFEIDAVGDRPPPVVGETIRRRGRLWKVTAWRGSERMPVVQVEAVDEERKRR